MCSLHFSWKWQRWSLFRSASLDLRLISDLMIIIVSASVGAVILTVVHQPFITGYHYRLLCWSWWHWFDRRTRPGKMFSYFSHDHNEVNLLNPRLKHCTVWCCVSFILTGSWVFYFKATSSSGCRSYRGSDRNIFHILVCGVFSDFTGASSKEGFFVELSSRCRQLWW